LPGLTRQSRAPFSVLAALDARLKAGHDVSHSACTVVLATGRERG
jgi:hypothetical protein